MSLEGRAQFTARTRGCITPASSGEFVAATAYSDRQMVKTGRAVTFEFDLSGNTMMHSYSFPDHVRTPQLASRRLTIFWPSGVAPVRGAVLLSLPSGTLPTMTDQGVGQDWSLVLSSTAANNTLAAIQAALDAASSGAKAAVNKRWSDAPAKNDATNEIAIGSGFGTAITETWQLRGPLTASPFYGEHPSLGAPWVKLANYTLEAAGQARSWCGAESAYENYVCGRCGNPL